MLFYYKFSRNDGSWIQIEGEGNNPAKVKNIKWSCNEGNNEIKFAKEAISDLHPGYGAVLNYIDHPNNLYVLALSFGHLCKYNYKHEDNNFISFKREEVKNKNINIKKGERIINVKGTSKVKAHKRRIKISKDLDRLGDKEKVTKGIVSTDYNESVKNVNNYITNLNQTDEGKKILYDVNSYTMNDYKHLNNYMKDPASLDTSIYNIDRLEKSIINIKKFINNAPKFKGEVYRGLQYNLNDSEAKQRWDSFIKNIESSKEIKFGSFLSTTTDTNVALNFAKKQYYGENLKSCIITIKTKSGVPIEHISQVPSEKEVLLDNDKIYKITEINKDDPDKIYIQMEEGK